MKKVAILGYGKMGQIREDVLKLREDVEIKYIYDPIVFGQDCINVDEIFKDEDIDILFICTPNKFNKEYTIRGLESGKHIFCEKPPAFTSQDVNEIIEVEKRSGKKLMYGFNHRSHGSIIKAKSVIDSNEYGKILWMRGRYGKRINPDMVDNWRMKKEVSGGGILLDQGIHMLDLLLHFADDFDEVQAMVSNLYWNLDIEDNVFANFRNNKNGIVASLHSTMTDWRFLFALEIFMEHGYVVINGLKTPSGSYGDEVLTLRKNEAEPPTVILGEPEYITYHTDESWEIETNNFFDAINNDVPIRNGNSKDALKVMSIIDKIYEGNNGR